MKFTFITTIRDLWLTLRDKSRIKALNKVIEDSIVVRDKAKQGALNAQTKRDALVTRLAARGV